MKSDHDLEQEDAIERAGDRLEASMEALVTRLETRLGAKMEAALAKAKLHFILFTTGILGALKTFYEYLNGTFG
ncbi:MAG: hypothetical protein ACR2P9_05495 [Gammaproteobacteria bacterium]